jgi:hypothetical protein
MISTAPHGGVRPSSRDVKVAFTESPGVKQSRQRWTPSNPASGPRRHILQEDHRRPEGRSGGGGRPSCRRTVDGQRHCLGCHASCRLSAVREELSSRGDPVGGRRLALWPRMVLRGWCHRPPPLRCVIDRVEDRRCRGEVPGVTCLLIRVGTRRHLRRPSHSPCLPAVLCPWHGHCASTWPRQDHRRRRLRL